MTFEDMMQMKRLGETAVSPDGQWLAYSVTTVDLDQNEKRAELWLQRISGGDPVKLAVAESGDSNPEFAPDGKSLVFVSSREGGQQLWLADFDPATGAASNPHKLTGLANRGRQPQMVARWALRAFYLLCVSGLSSDYLGRFRLR